MHTTPHAVLQLSRWHRWREKGRWRGEGEREMDGVREREGERERSEGDGWG